MVRLRRAATASEREEIECLLEAWKKEHEKEKEYVSKTSLDLVIATSDPIPSPLLAIEVDGHSHNSPYQQQKDAMKNTLCEQAGLPLIRITYDYLPQQQEQSHQAKYARRIRVEFIRFMIRRLVALMDTEHQLWREHFEAIEAYQALPELERMHAESEDWRDRFWILDSSEEYDSQDLYYKTQELGCLAGGSPEIRHVSDKDGRLRGSLYLIGNRLGLRIPEGGNITTPSIRLSGANPSWSSLAHLISYFIDSFLLQQGIELCEGRRAVERYKS
jgi:hypothetical protein